jgi:hypothetical protein
MQSGKVTESAESNRRDALLGGLFGPGSLFEVFRASVILFEVF